MNFFEQLMPLDHFLTLIIQDFTAKGLSRYALSLNQYRGYTLRRQ
jgi:hypothetical protein